MKRVHIVTDADLTKKHTPAVRIISLAKYLARLGLEVYFIFPIWENQFPKLPPGIISIPIYVSKNSLVRARIFQPKLLLELNHLPRPDAVYFRISPWMIAPLIWARYIGIPVFVEVHGIPIVEYTTSFKVESTMDRLLKWPKLLRMKMIERITLKNATGVIFVTEQLEKHYAQRYRLSREKTVVISNGVDIEMFYPMDKYQSRQQMGIQQFEGVILGFVGALENWQGLDDAIFAVKLLADRNVICRLLIIGQGSEEARLQTLIRRAGLSDRVLLMGPMDFDMMPACINAFDICLVPKRDAISGYSPLKLYQYMACAKPIVATNVPGLDIVTKLGAGVNANAGSPESLADAIEELIRRRNEWEDMGRRGRLYVEKNASWQYVAERTVLFFKDRIGTFW